MGDTEGNSLTPTLFHCGVFKNLSRPDEILRFTPQTAHLMPSFINDQKIVALHNGISWDCVWLEKVFGTPINRKVIRDSLVLSRLGNSRRGTKGANPMDDRLMESFPVISRKPHSIEAWGVRFGLYKPEMEQWDVFTPEMMQRCERDVEIGYLTLKYLMQKELNYVI